MQINKQIAELLKQLHDAHMDVWDATKRQFVLENTHDQLTKKHRANARQSATAAKLEDAMIRDNALAEASTEMAQDLLANYQQHINDLRATKEKNLRDYIFDILKERLNLLSRSYHKIDRAVFALRARVQMRIQELHAVELHKQRANAAQDSAKVLQCHQEKADLLEDIEALNAQREQLEVRLAERKRDWTDCFATIKELAHLDERYQKEIPEIEQEFNKLLTKLREIEENEKSKLHLDNQLDAAFMTKTAKGYIEPTDSIMRENYRNILPSRAEHLASASSGRDQ